MEEDNNDVLKDDSLMPMGKYKGQLMADLPEAYLLWLWGENKVTFNIFMGKKMMKPELKCVMAYIEDSFDEKKL